MFNKTPGEHRVTLQGKIGSLEAAIVIPESMSSQYIAILGHPHSLQGGTMENKVVTTLARTFKELGIASVRFNFRGVGHSVGAYDEGIGESEDMLCIAKQCLFSIPGAQLCFAGFSFGSFVAYRTAALHPHALLITIAPPVHHYDYLSLPIATKHWVIVQGDEDDVSPLSLVLDFAQKRQISIVRFAEAGHFFHGQLIPLKSKLLELIPQYLAV